MSYFCPVWASEIPIFCLFFFRRDGRFKYESGERVNTQNFPLNIKIGILHTKKIRKGGGYGGWGVTMTLLNP